MKIAGINYVFDWGKFKRGKEMFFPCLDYEQATKEVQAEADLVGAEVFILHGLKENIRGLRVWRM